MKAQISFSYSIEMEPTEFKTNSRTLKQVVKTLGKVARERPGGPSRKQADLMEALTRFIDSTAERSAPPFTMPAGPPDFSVPWEESEAEGDGESTDGAESAEGDAGAEGEGDGDESAEGDGDENWRTPRWDRPFGS